MLLWCRPTLLDMSDENNMATSVEALFLSMTKRAGSGVATLPPSLRGVQFQERKKSGKASVQAMTMTCGMCKQRVAIAEMSAHMEGECPGANTGRSSVESIAAATGEASAASSSATSDVASAAAAPAVDSLANNDEMQRVRRELEEMKAELAKVRGDPHLVLLNVWCWAATARLGPLAREKLP